MYLDAILEVAIGLVFTWLVLSIATMQVQEWISSWRQLRAQFLEESIKNMLQGENLVEEFYKHPMIVSLSSPGRKPSYIPAERFAQTLEEVYFQQSEEEKQWLILEKKPKFEDAEEIIKYAEKKTPSGNLELEDVKGIGPKLAERLRKKGITTIGDLANITPDDFKNTMGPRYARLANKEKILRHAEKLALYDDLELEDVKGIGPKLAERLRKKGITTIGDLANITPDDFKDTMGPRYARFANKEKIIERAKRLTSHKNVELEDIRE